MTNNDRFRLDSDINRDDSNYPFFLLREKLLSCNVELNTPDLNVKNLVSLELHMNVSREKCDTPKFVLLLETPEVYEPNSVSSKILEYQHVFTWRKDLQLQHQSSINFPNTYRGNKFKGWLERDGFACLIASGSKGLRINSKDDLYKQRIETIKWFENYAPNNFDLYGGGWESNISPKNKLAKLNRRISIPIFKIFGYRPYPSYRGRVAKKADVLQRYKFNICYENISSWPGYITEKIFDSFFSGCIPIYWGAPDIDKYIPEACFIDRRKFSTHGELFEYLQSITPSQFVRFQEEIAHFLRSDQATDFYAEKFSEKITTVIVDFLNLSKKSIETIQ